jgi:anti-anti-sigma factor
MATISPKALLPLRIEGALDVQNATTLRAAIIDRLSVPAPVYEIDLASVSACDSAGLQLLCAARQSALSAGAAWRLTNPPESVLRACAEMALSPKEIGL